MIDPDTNRCFLAFFLGALYGVAAWTGFAILLWWLG